MRLFSALITLGLMACSPAPVLDGSWEGELDCGAAARYDIDIELETQTEVLFVGSGVAELVCSDGQKCDLEFEIELALDEEQESLWKLDVDMDDCELSYSGGSEDYSCPDVDDVILRDDIIEGEFEIDSLDCEMMLEP